MLVDTNILVLTSNPGHPQTAIVRDTLKDLFRRHVDLTITPQNLVEFWSVATKPVTSNGLGLTPEQAREEVNRLKEIFSLLPDTPAIYRAFEAVVEQYKITGRNAFDARLVASMRVHGERSILTFDEGFSRYAPEIEIVHPGSLIASLPMPQP
jgi:predicted nucleic acid-binding protein